MLYEVITALREHLAADDDVPPGGEDPSLDQDQGDEVEQLPQFVITSYSIHYTKLYELQGRPAVLIIAVVLAAGALAGLLLFFAMRQALGDASASGHFGFPTPFRIVSGILLRQLLALFALVFAGA